MKTQNPPASRFLVLFALGFFALSQLAQAVNPPPDGGYAGGNTAEGTSALSSLTTGLYNTAVGVYSGLSLTDGNFNTALGAGTLLANTADENTATGAGALLSDTIGDRNTANGAFALFSNTTGIANTAIGSSALLSNTEGDGNTAVGEGALNQNTTAVQNNAVGRGALAITQTNGFNNAFGAFALSVNTGVGNTAIGDHAGSFLTTGNFNVCIGVNVNGVAGESNTTRIRNIYTTVQPQVGTDPDLVTINSSGRLGRANVSSRRYKHDIQPMDKASEAIYTLKPVSFRYHKQYDATQTVAFGLIAEEVAEVAPDLVGRNEKGEPESVRYEQVNAMLLNEFLKEHTRGEEQDRKIQEQEETIAQLKKNVDSLFARLKEHDSKIQRVTAELN
jgi:hypothetical protein